MTPLEREARVLARYHAELQFGDSCTEQDRADEEVDWQDYLPGAKIVIEALREPSEAMLGAGLGRKNPGQPDDVWTAMIDAALAEAPQPKPQGEAAA
jgi:hypothetical protein